MFKNSAIHDQGYESVCWAYAISSMLRASIRSAVEKYDIKNGHKILNNPSHHKIMRKELCMNIFPFGLDGADPFMAIKLVSYNILKLLNFPLSSTQTPSVQHIDSTQGPHVFNTQNPSVQHQNLSVQHQKPLSSTHFSVPHQKPLGSTPKLLISTQGVWNSGIFGLELRRVWN